MQGCTAAAQQNNALCGAWAPQFLALLAFGEAQLENHLALAEQVSYYDSLLSQCCLQFYKCSGTALLQVSAAWLALHPRLCMLPSKLEEA